MKKVLTIVMALVLLSSLMAEVVRAEDVVTLEAKDFVVQYKAAPAIAGLLLEEAGIDNRYGSGKGGINYISEVALHMDDNGYFNGVGKEDVARYRYEIAKYLNSILRDDKKVNVEHLDSILLSAVYEGEGDLFGGHVGDRMTFTFSNDIQATGTLIKVYFKTATKFDEVWGKANYEVNGKTLTVTVTEVWSLYRPEIGDNVIGFEGIKDFKGDIVVIPEEGVQVTR